jgi:hypothetical protein
VQRSRVDAQAVVELGDPPAEAVELGREGREAVGLVMADVPDAGELARSVGERGEGDEASSGLGGLPLRIIFYLP